MSRKAIKKALRTAPDTSSVIKSAVAEVIAPLQKMLAKQQRQFDARLAEQKKIIDAIADAPDPLNSYKSVWPVRARPVGVPDIAETAERWLETKFLQFEHIWRTTEDPTEREVAWTAIRKLAKGR